MSLKATTKQEKNSKLVAKRLNQEKTLFTKQQKNAIIEKSLEQTALFQTKILQALKEFID